MSEAVNDIIIKVNGTPVSFSVINGFAEMNRNTTAITPGPLVYCAEETDNGCKVQELAIKPCGDASVSTVRSGILEGIPAIDCQGDRIIRLIPYFAWNNRGDGQSMMVWLKNE